MRLAKFEAKSRLETRHTKGMVSLKRKILTKKLDKPSWLKMRQARVTSGFAF